MIEVEFDIINSIYNEYGFRGVINYIERWLEYGELTETQEGLYRITTGGWLEDEWLVGGLTHMRSLFGNNHYVGYLRGGAYYFAENMEDNDFEVTKKDGTIKMEDKK